MPDENRQMENIVISLRLDPEIAEAFRTEAARRNTRLVYLFEEMWELYQSQPVKPSHSPRPRRRRK